MKTLLFLAAICTAHAQSPGLTVRQPDGSLKILAIEEADIGVRILGDVAETVIELNFRNDDHRVAEGEFVLPLPAGATVSGYALEVNGEMRAAVSVEKQRARTAYETVKNRKIDPGIVEREAGNIYRTQIYPIPAKGTKRLRISYTESLQETYSLPLDFPAPVKSFSLKVEGTDLEIIDKAGADLTERKEANLIECTMESFAAKGTLKVGFAQPEDGLLLLGVAEQPAFMASILPPDLAPRERPAPKSVALIWDASGSGLGRDRAAELALLDAWFGKLSAVSVKLFTLRNTMEEAGAFEIRGGKWDKLRKALETVDYDGATDFSQIAVPAGTADLTLLFSDGISTLGQSAPGIAGPWYFIHPESTATGSQLAHLALESGGDAIALAAEGIKPGLERLTHIPPRLISVSGNWVRDAIIGERIERGKRMHVFGTLRQADFGGIDLQFGFGSEAVETRTVSASHVSSPDKVIDRLHAQRELAEMERKMPVDSAEIIAHCKREGLVSDFTSLIVLERIEDYAQHGIRPPESELWKDYDRLVARFRNENATRFEWRDKVEWHSRNFPGYEVSMLPRMKQVGIWKMAVEKQFKPGQRDAEAFGVISGWHEKGITLLEQIPAIRNQGEYDVWKNSVDELNRQGAKLAATPLHAPPAGKELAVSVRGLVDQPGVITSDKPMTLRSALAGAGKLHPMGSLDNIALYRNAGKTVYNTLSEKFEDFPLFPMDMVVIGNRDAYDEYGGDPFADSSPGTSPSQEAPIREQEDVWITPRNRDIGPLGGGPVASRNQTILVGAEFSNESLDEKDFTKQLAAGVDPATAYRKQRGDLMRAPDFYIGAARILFSNKQEALAKQVLSNLAETRQGDVPALRSLAFWLAEFGNTQEAEMILEGIQRGTDSDALVAMDLAALRTARGAFREAFSGWLNPMANITAQGSLAQIALTDFNSLREKASDSARPDPDPFPGYGARFAQTLPADIRIVLTCADDAVTMNFNVTEPGGFESLAEWPQTPSGGRFTSSRGVAEYMIRRAVLGKYRIECRTNTPTTVRLSIHQDWGRPNQTTRTLTFISDPGKSETAEFDFAFRPHE